MEFGFPKMHNSRAEVWKFNYDHKAYFDTFYDCRSTECLYAEATRDMVKLYHNLMKDGICLTALKYLFY